MTELDRYLDDLGRHLATARPRPRTRVVVLAATGALALVAALAVSLIGGGGATSHRALPVGPVDAIAKARAALTVPPGQMLHLRLKTVLPDGSERSTTDELWVASDPLRWRQHSTSTVGRGMDQMSAFGGGVSSYYNAESNSLRRITGYAADSPQSKVRTLLGTGEGNPDDDLRAALEQGRLVDAGEQQVGGRTVRRLESKDKDDPKTLIVLIYDVDPQTFEPVGGERVYYLPPKRRGGPRREAGPSYHFTVEVYERVPIDESKLTIQTNARTKVDELTAAQFLRRMKARRRAEQRCSKLHAKDPRAKCPTSP